MSSDVSDDPWIDQVVNGRYRVIRLLGEGGMSRVYEVEHVKLKRQFALKLLLPSLATNPEALLRFEREAEVLASLRHPNIVGIVDWDVLAEGAPYMVLEFLHGASIRVRMDRGQLPWDAIARIGDQAMAALSLAHRVGVTHRDLKPENIYISIDDAGDEHVKLLDFGVSKLHRADRTTGQHTMLGTPSYMSPEQAQGESDSIGPSTDVWAMGTILYEMATRRVAFTGESLVQTVVNITSGRPAPITTFRLDAPAAFVELVDRATTLDAERRIVTIEELRERLRGALVRVNHPTAGIQRLPAPAAAAAQPSPRAGSAPSGAAPGPSARPSSSPSPATSMHALPGETDQLKSQRRLVWILGTTAVLAIAGLIAVVIAT